MILVTDREFEQLDFSDVKDNELAELTGLKIIGAEPLNPPATEGTVFYLTSDQGERVVIITEYDIIEGKYNIRFATVNKEVKP
ncbi:MAG: hypothetical protein IIT39_02450 [Clostridia bacterium]|nr:hypothetical protein [Clostridia bacterium]